MIKRLIVIAALLLCAPWVCAEDYYWKNDSVNTHIKFSSPAEVHADYISFMLDFHPNYMLANDSLTKENDSKFISSLTFSHSCGVFGDEECFATYIVFVYRYGHGCPSGKIYNNENGTCEESCEAKQGQNVSYFAKHSLGFPDPHKFCMNGCTIFRMQGECAGHNDDPINDRACWGIAEYWQGEQCEEGEFPAIEGGSPPPKNPSDNTPEPPKDPNHPDPDQCPPGYFFNGSFCSPIEPENDGCPDGMVKQDNGHCVTPLPGDTPPNNGGGGGGGGGTGGGSGNGDDGGEGSGNGGGGNGNGEGEGGGSGGSGGGGNGNGSGECEDEICPSEEDQEGTVSGESCDVDLVCEGDAIQCAILQQQKKQACLLDNDHLGHNDMIADNEEQAEADKSFFEGLGQELPIGGLFNDAKNTGSWLPKSCPAPRTFTAQGRTLSFEFTLVCQYAQWMAPLIVLLSSLFFLVTVGRAVKG